MTAQLGGPLVEFSQSVERTTVEVLAELKPGRQLYTNVEFYAGVVMHSCGIPREMFTPTFATGAPSGGARTSWNRRDTTASSARPPGTSGRRRPNRSRFLRPEPASPMPAPGRRRPKAD